MKRITFIILGLAIAVMAATDASAKGKAIPNASTIMAFLNKLNKSNHASRITPPAGVKLIASNLHDIDEPIDYGWLFFGNNVSLTCDSDGNVDNINVTGPHAFYFDWNNCSDAGNIIFFKSKADCDTFLRTLKKTRYYYKGCKPLFMDGWYQIILVSGN